MRHVKLDTNASGAQRGVALILALIMVVLMTAFTVDFNYSANVKNLSAYHYRDNTRSYYLAKGGVRLYSMLLVFGRQISGNSMVSGMLSQFGLDMDGAAMVCRSIPFLDTAMLRFLQGASGGIGDEEQEGLLSMLGIDTGEDDSSTKTKTKPKAHGATDPMSDDKESLRRGLMDFEGDFKVTCADESAKIDLNGFGATKWAGLTLQQHPTGQMLYGLMSPPEYDPLFEERLKIDRWELIGNIKDWVDVDSQRSGLLGGDEDSLYDDFEPRYRAKNSAFDTVEELRLVASVTDEVFEIFGPSLSVHTRNYKINVNTANPAMIRALIRAFSDPSIVTDQRLDTEIVPLLIAERTFLPGPFRNSADFIARLKAKQVVFISPDAESQLKELVSTDSRVFLLESTGYVNESTADIKTTVRINRSSVRYLDWKEL